MNKEAQTWLNEIERRASLGSEKKRERPPRNVGGIPSEPEDVGGTIARLEALCLALQEGRIPEVIFQSDIE